MDTNLRGDDPRRWGHSLANLAELLIAVLDAAEARSVLEIGAYAGELTRDVLDWAARAGARVVAVDPTPQAELVELSERVDELELIPKTSAEALPSLAMPDAVIIDGDHNYYTVSQELGRIDERSAGAKLPLLVLHDVCWPHGRRDGYDAPERVPDAHRQPMAEDAGLFPGEPGTVFGGLPCRWAAEREGGPANGVLTAIEDFVRGRSHLRLAIVPAFFGMAIAWHEDAPWASAVAEVVEPFDRNPVLGRLEANRVFHLAAEHVRNAELNRLRERNAWHEHLLRGMLSSRRFTIADRLAWRRGRERSWREQVRQALDEGEGSG